MPDPKPPHPVDVLDKMMRALAEDHNLELAPDYEKLIAEAREYCDQIVTVGLETLFSKKDL